jgi:hypothetical protein
MHQHQHMVLGIFLINEEKLLLHLKLSLHELLKYIMYLNSRECYQHILFLLDPKINNQFILSYFDHNKEKLQ